MPLATNVATNTASAPQPSASLRYFGPGTALSLGWVVSNEPAFRGMSRVATLSTLSGVFSQRLAHAVGGGALGKGQGGADGDAVSPAQVLER